MVDGRLVVATPSKVMVIACRRHLSFAIGLVNVQSF